MSTIQQEVNEQVNDALLDYPDMGETDLFHCAAYNVCSERYYGGDKQAANDFWKAHFGETFTKRLTRPL